MKCVAGGETAEYVYTARRNNSLSSSGRQLVFAFILFVSLGIATGFYVVFDAWPVLPYAAIEMTALYCAFRYMERHAADFERITIRGGTVAIESQDGPHVKRLELNRHWAKVVCDADGGHLALRTHGREIPVGRHLCEERRLDLARELMRELRG
ncbi:MAG TPA: DUF2244 domain-containing protein [Burkholderiales bacterium]|nr:DUF2244 domain-containing protein [Burkholderiales bacterium]